MLLPGFGDDADFRIREQKAHHVFFFSLVLNLPGSVSNEMRIRPESLRLISFRQLLQVGTFLVKAEQSFVADDIARMQEAKIGEGVFHPFFKNYSGSFFSGNAACAGGVAISRAVG